MRPTDAQKKLMAYIQRHPRYEPRTRHKRKILERVLNAGFVIRTETGALEVVYEPRHCINTVYVARETETGLLKIGYAYDVSRRMERLQAGNPRRLELVCWCKGSRQDEGDLHRRLKPWRVRGDWYTASAEVLAVVKEIEKCP